ncbi:PorT family protein [Flavobacterium ranwuense]|uniref:PorT family protein n=1 Tax=Flavobacterium ranwuense TaxID=2541725 RepID=A0ABY2DWB6_9FLAO|nr:outer membrane beta-barrel protein [Flavobacterium ranwuense]TDE31723.1 PorT family protein [Flavobacterium ranwuense]
MSKKGFIIAVFALLGVAQVQAQVTFKPGIQIGLNFSKIQNANLSTKTDFYLGAFGALKLSKFYTLQPELVYSRQGGKGKVDGFYYEQVSPFEINTVYEERDADISLQYLSFVTINKFNLYMNFYILVGPCFDILVGNDFKIDENKDFNANVSKGEDIDFGIIGGVGFSLPKGISLEARIKKGTRDVFDDNTGSANVNSNLVYQIGATYIFGLN